MGIRLSAFFYVSLLFCKFIGQTTGKVNIKLHVHCSIKKKNNIPHNRLKLEVQQSECGVYFNLQY